jgi:O-acetyl-ADP-ribose deacetylase (regulator of RNase III)
MPSYRIGKSTALVLERGDITKLPVDAIVNAANERMLGGGGVDGAIHRAAGPELLEACRAIELVEHGVRCPTGEARITPGFALPAAWVIHTVGPVYRGPQSATLLSAAYRSALAIAGDKQLSSVAFPAISCGVYGYPLNDAAALALAACRDHASAAPGSRPPGATLREIRFALFGDDAFAAFRDAADQLFSGG